MSFVETVLTLFFGAASAAFVLFWALRSVKLEATPTAQREEKFSFLFENGELLDLSNDAEAFLTLHGDLTDLKGITRLFMSRFRISEDELVMSETEGTYLYSARDPKDQSQLELSYQGNLTRLRIKGLNQSSEVLGQKLFELNAELSSLRNANAVSPNPIWQVSKSGQVTWYNPAYVELHQRVFKHNPNPDIPLFRLPEPSLEQGKTRRVPITPINSRQSVWFDVRRTETTIGDFYSAVDANAIVRAEAAQRNFVQTLAKTFAHLPIGLAIFDDNRQLVLFNPAVIDLTGLGADFLSSRPNLLSFFDELRNRRLMPEPKNYHSWRQQIADLVAAAADGRYSEIWTLDSGRTYRVNGRPHPDGAIAFLIEDISAEISLTRRFRAELELGQSVLDHVRAAVAVFDSNGVLTMSNAAYRDFWDVDPEGSFAEVTIVDCMRVWKDSCKPSPVFGELRDFTLEFRERVAWSADVNLLNDTHLAIDVAPLQSGSTMISFEETSVRTEALPESQEVYPAEKA